MTSEHKRGDSQSTAAAAQSTKMGRRSPQAAFGLYGLRIFTLWCTNGFLSGGTARPRPKFSLHM